MIVIVGFFMISVAEVNFQAPGCEFIEIYRDTQKPDVVNVWEIWSDRPSWDAHMVNANSKAWQAIGPNYVFGETITVMDAL